MLDPLLRRVIDAPLNRFGVVLAALGVRPNVLTVCGLAIGLMVVPLLATEEYELALLAVCLNRIADGLDGAVARQTGATDFGGYLDIVCDMMFYAAFVVGFGLARPENLMWSVVLLASFVGTASSFLGWAIIAAKRSLTSTTHGEKSFLYSVGLVEGTETILFFAAMCLWPDAFAWLAGLLTVLCVWTTIGRVMAARRAFQP
jgi:phosphatidylglycerophosphate synthase